MHIERTNRCGDWFKQNFSIYDEKYGEQATNFLLNTANGKNFVGNVI